MKSFTGQSKFLALIFFKKNQVSTILGNLALQFYHYKNLNLNL